MTDRDRGWELSHLVSNNMTIRQLGANLFLRHDIFFVAKLRYRGRSFVNIVDSEMLYVEDDAIPTNSQLLI